MSNLIEASRPCYQTAKRPILALAHAPAAGCPRYERRRTGERPHVAGRRAAVRVLARVARVLRQSPATLPLLVVVLAALPARGDHNFQIFASGNSSDLIGDLSSITTETLSIYNSTTVLTFDSIWNNGQSASRTYWKLYDGSQVAVTGAAAINNNMPDLINARPFQVQGYGTIEFLPEFNADHTGYLPGMDYTQTVAYYGGDGSWAANGLSTLTLIGNVTMISHASQNLPSIHKLGHELNNDIVHTHHGLITITDEPGPLWIVKSNDQQYDGGINWSVDWTLQTDADLTFTGIYEPRAKVSFGSRAEGVATLTKIGSGRLVIDGTQAYNPGTAIMVAEGAVEFFTDPSDYGPYYPIWHWTAKYADQNEGQNLVLSILAGATCSFLAEQHGLQSLTSLGTVLMELSAADMARDYKVKLRQDLVQGGNLAITDDDHDMAPGVYDLFDAGSFTGQFNLLLPAGYGGDYDNGTGELRIWAVPEPGTLSLLAAASTISLVIGLGHRRRGAGCTSAAVAPHSGEYHPA